MVRRIPFLCFAFGLWTAVGATSALAQAGSLRDSLAELVHQAPVTPENLQQMDVQEFGRQAEEILVALEGTGVTLNLRPPPDGSDPLMVELYYSDTEYWLGELEHVLRADMEVTSQVTVVSTPEGADFKYRATSASDVERFLDGTTEFERHLEAAWYDFVATNPETGERIEKTEDCSTDCTVVLF